MITKIKRSVPKYRKVVIIRLTQYKYESAKAAGIKMSKKECLDLVLKELKIEVVP